MMSALGQMATWHLLFWVVPLVLAIVCSAVGGRVHRRAAEALAAVGLVWPLVQAAAAAAWFLWFSPREQTELVVLPLAGAHGDFAWNFALDAVGAWACCLSSALGLLALVQAALVTRGWVGRHRYFALLLLTVASVNLLATSRSLLALLLGWEGSLLASAFMLGFWEAEEGERRTGMRWLLFQHLSAVCLLIGCLLLPGQSQAAQTFIAISLVLRLGLVPAHGWVVEQSRAPSSAQALVQTLASLLAAALLMERFAGVLLQTAWVVELMQGLSLATVVVGILAALQQHRLSSRISWLALVSSGLLTLVYFLQDPTAGRILATAHGLIWCAAILTLGAVEIFENDPLRLPDQKGQKALSLGLALALAAPPGLSALALGRALSAIAAFWPRWLLAAAVLLVFAAIGWVLGQVSRTVERMLVGEQPPAGRRVRGIYTASWAGLGLVFLLGAALLVLEGFSPLVYGGVSGLFCSLIMGAAAVAGWPLGSRKVRPVEVQVLSWRRGRWWMEQLAETGLGVGELLVRLPLVALRSLGVLVGRVAGDFLLEGVVIGGGMRLAGGLGRVLQYLHNGQVQRYLFFLLLLALVLIWLLG